MDTTTTPCSVTHVFHYLRPEADPRSLDSILSRGLLPLSAMPEHPQYDEQLGANPDRFTQRYAELAEPVLRKAYHNSGVFFTTIDFRRLPGSPLENGIRIALPMDRLDPDWTVVTDQLGDDRRCLPFHAGSLTAVAKVWTAEQIERWLGAHPRGYFFHVPQIITFQPGGVPITESDVEKGD
ncbi:hypothetical protein [Flindersiella endophytica]